MSRFLLSKEMPKLTKHEQILKYIESLTTGEKISVRRIAKHLHVSEGTAYRAIKDAENKGLVSTIQRVGTMRIAKMPEKTIEKLTFADVLNIVEGTYLGGSLGKGRHLDKFVIGAMEEEAILRYIDKSSLMIVGNRLSVQKQALEHGAAVLITGGFDTTDEIKMIANNKELPLISTTYDSFTVATMINKALSNQMIKKEIVMVEDVMTPLTNTHFLYSDQTVFDYQSLEEKTGHSRIPIVNHHHQFLGMVTAKDVMGKDLTVQLGAIMQRKVKAARKQMSVAAVAHLMIWEGYELVAVIHDDRTLLGVVSRQDIMKAMQTSQRHLQSLNTFSDQIDTEIKKGNQNYEMLVTPSMINSDGVMSYGIVAETVTDIAKRVITSQKKASVLIEQVNLHYLKVIQIDKILQIFPRILDEGKYASTIDIDIYIDNQIMAKATVVCHVIEDE